MDDNLFTPGKRLGSPSVKQRPSPLLVFLIDLSFDGLEDALQGWLESIAAFVKDTLHYYYFYVDARVTWTAEWFELASAGKLMARPQKLPIQCVTESSIDLLKAKILSAGQDLYKRGRENDERGRRQSVQSLHNADPRPPLANLLTVLRRALSDYKWSASWTITKDTSVDFFSPTKAVKRSYKQTPTRKVGLQLHDGNNPFAYKATNVRNYCFMLSPLDYTSEGFMRYVWGATATLRLTHSEAELADTVSEFASQWIDNGIYEEYVQQNRIALNWVNTTACAPRSPADETLLNCLRAHMDHFGGSLIPLEIARSCLRGAPSLAKVFRRKVIDTSAGGQWTRAHVADRTALLLKHYQRMVRRSLWLEDGTKTLHMKLGDTRIDLSIARALQGRAWYNKASFVANSELDHTLEFAPPSLEEVVEGCELKVIATLSLSRWTPEFTAAVHKSYPAPLFVWSSSASRKSFSAVTANLWQLNRSLVVTVCCRLRKDLVQSSVSTPTEPDPFWDPPTPDTISDLSDTFHDAVLLPSFHKNGLYLLFLQPNWRNLLDRPEHGSTRSTRWEHQRWYYQWPYAIYPLFESPSMKESFSIGAKSELQFARVKHSISSKNLVNLPSCSPSVCKEDDANEAKGELLRGAENLDQVDGKIRAILAEVALSQSCSLSKVYSEIIPMLEQLALGVKGVPHEKGVCCLLAALLSHLHTLEEIEARYASLELTISEGADCEKRLSSTFAQCEIKVVRFLLQERHPSVTDVFVYEGRVWESQLVLLLVVALLELLEKHSQSCEFQVLTKALESSASSALAKAVLIFIQTHSLDPLVTLCDFIFDRLLIDYITVDLSVSYALEKIGQAEADGGREEDDNAVALISLFRRLEKRSPFSLRLVSHWSVKAGVDDEATPESDRSNSYCSPLSGSALMKRKFTATTSSRSSSTKVALFRPTSESSRRILEKAFQRDRSPPKVPNAESKENLEPETPRSAKRRQKREREQKKQLALTKSKKLESFLATRGIQFMRGRGSRK